ncbi:23531_t:CDS:2 [Dentiscutata erythropus]|uniref:23531_t:CDS:1 n=1 Tax=Dentiscutata erythropus TaxID=1348616 RepID=A0A9N9FGN3_9GLOM|nr:23531_t:CDS:2 [Dentiscutata erythropus]
MGKSYSKLRSSTKSHYYKFKRLKKVFQGDVTIIEGRKFYNIEHLYYQLPSDDLEIDRLQLQHYLMRYVWQLKFSSPVRDLLREGGVRVLDVGPLTIKPNNTDFVEVDILGGLPFPDEYVL